MLIKTITSEETSKLTIQIRGTPESMYNCITGVTCTITIHASKIKNLVEAGKIPAKNSLGVPLEHLEKGHLGGRNRPYVIQIIRLGL